MLGMRPADESLATDNLAIIAFDDWLIVNLEIIVGERISKAHLDDVPVAHALVHRFFKERKFSTARALCTVKREVGVFHQLSRVAGVVRCE